MQFDYEKVQATALKSLQQLDADLKVRRPAQELERETHEFASVIVDVFNENEK